METLNTPCHSPSSSSSGSSSSNTSSSTSTTSDSEQDYKSEQEFCFPEEEFLLSMEVPPTTEQPMEITPRTDMVMDEPAIEESPVATHIRHSIDALIRNTIQKECDNGNMSAGAAAGQLEPEKEKTPLFDDLMISDEDDELLRKLASDNQAPSAPTLSTVDSKKCREEEEMTGEHMAKLMKSSYFGKTCAPPSTTTVDSKKCKEEEEDLPKLEPCSPPPIPAKHPGKRSYVRRPGRPKKHLLQKCSRCRYVSKLFTLGCESGYVDVTFNSYALDRNDNNTDCNRCSRIFFEL